MNEERTGKSLRQVEHMVISVVICYAYIPKEFQNTKRKY